MDNGGSNTMEKYRIMAEKLLSELGNIPLKDRAGCIADISQLVQSCMEAEVRFAALGVLKNIDMESDNFDAEIAERILDTVEDIIDSGEYGEYDDFGDDGFDEEDYDDFGGDEDDGEEPLSIIDLDKGHKE